MAKPHQPPADRTTPPADSSGRAGEHAFTSTGPLTEPPFAAGATIDLPGTVTATTPQQSPSRAVPPATATPPPLPGPGPTRAGGGPQRWLVLIGCAVLGSALGIGAQRISMGTENDLATPPATSASPTASPTPVPAQVSSFSPSGTGFPNHTGDSWGSQSYASATFGNLKPGIGLVLDLGAARTLSQVTFNADTSPLTVQLRAGDAPPTDPNALAQVGSPVSASGATSLPATNGGSHRYWMIWVTQLAPNSGQYTAKISNPTARG